MKYFIKHQPVSTVYLENAHRKIKKISLIYNITEKFFNFTIWGLPQNSHSLGIYTLAK